MVEFFDGHVIGFSVWIASKVELVNKFTSSFGVFRPNTSDLVDVDVEAGG